MDVIEVKIKVTPNPHLYIVKMESSDTILDLKKECEKITKIPYSLQNLVFNAQILINTKTIRYYEIKNGQRIILVKKLTEPPPETKSENNTDINNNTSLIKRNVNINENLTRNNNNRLGLLDIFSLSLKNMNVDEINNIKENFLGLGQRNSLGSLNPKFFEQLLNNPYYIQYTKSMFKNPEILKIFCQETMKIKFIDSNPQLKKIFEVTSKLLDNPMYNDIIANFASKFYFNDNKNTIDEIMDDLNLEENKIEGLYELCKIFFKDSEINIENKNEIRTKKKEEKIDKKNEEKKDIKKCENESLKEKYKKELNELKNMGFDDEEKNIRALKECNGNIDLALEKF